MSSMPEPSQTAERINDSLAPDETTEYGKGYADGFVHGVAAAKAVTQSPAERLVDETAEQWAAENRELLGCPDWCTDDHGPVDVRVDLITHMGDDHTDGTVRRLLDATTLDIRVARTDSPLEGTVGAPNLYVRCDVELTTWQQAAELARTILDGFGYLEGADRD